MKRFKRLFPLVAGLFFIFLLYVGDVNRSARHHSQESFILLKVLNLLDAGKSDEAREFMERELELNVVIIAKDGRCVFGPRKRELLQTVRQIADYFEAHHGGFKVPQWRKTIAPVVEKARKAEGTN